VTRVGIDAEVGNAEAVFLAQLVVGGLQSGVSSSLSARASTFSAGRHSLRLP
jgi:hypothetical protein